MIISDRFEYVYVCPQKTGTLSVRRWLEAYYNGVSFGKYHGMEVPRENYLVFMTVRNPYDRMVSLWCFRENWRRETFQQQCQRYKDMRYGLVDIRERTGATIFLRLEALQDEITKLPFFDPTKPRPGHRRKAMNKLGARMLTPADQKAARRIFAEDYKEFGYA